MASGEPMAAMTEASSTAFANFVARGTAFLDAVSFKNVVYAVDASTVCWHPTGFVVAYTSLRFEGNPVRLHCWPKGHRVRPADHPPIHNHVWPLCSRVVAGIYTERILSLDVDHSTSPELELYEVEYQSRFQSTLRATGRYMRTSSSRSQSFVAGRTHASRADEWHESVVPDHETAVTVMVTGDAVGTPLLAGRPRLAGGACVRPCVTAREFAGYLSAAAPEIESTRIR